MITQICLKQITSYNEEVVINDIKKLNFFYGNNGSGKSSIAKYLYNITVSEDNQYLNIENCSQVGYNNETSQLLVFDEKFIERNFIENENLNGIFSLDEQNDEIDNIIKAEQDKIKANELFSQELEDSEESLLQSKQTNFNTLKNQVFRKRDTFKDFTKLSLKHSGNSSNHLGEIIKILNEGKEKDISLTDISSNYHELFEKDIVEIKTNVNPQLYKELRKLEGKINKVLDDVIIGNQDVDIASLIESLNIKKWVEEGVNYIDKNLEEEQSCPFCQENTINKGLVEKFESYFDETYKNKIKEIEDLKEEYQTCSDKIISNIQDIEEVYNPNQETTITKKELSQFFLDNLSIVQYKIDNSNEKKVLSSLVEHKERLSDLLKSINTQNNNFNTLGDKKEKLTEEVWSYLAFHSKEEIEKNILEEYFLALDFFEHNKIKKLVYVESQKSRKVIEENRSNTIDTDKAKDKINNILASSGISGFRIEKIEEDSNIPKYFIKREESSSSSSDVFKTLSEGEKNFISFLYFHQLCIGADNETNREKKKIVIIDDPVSSLDSQVLFLVTTLIRDLSKKKGRGSLKNDFFNESILQVFILTHNTYFFKEVAFNHEHKLCNETAFFQVAKINGNSSVTRLDKNIIDNDYNLLWRALIELKTNSENQSNIVIGNIMRRILQTFLNFTRTNSNEWKIIEELPQEDPKRIIFSSLISQINDDSHESNPLDELHFQRISQANTNDLFDVFELIFKDIGGEEHYNSMLQI